MSLHLIKLIAQQSTLMVLRDLRFAMVSSKEGKTKDNFISVEWWYTERRERV